MEWLDFVVCAFMGWTGIHKFKERKVVAGTLYFLTLGLCGIGWLADTARYLVAAVKRTAEIGRARSKRLSGRELPPPIEALELLELKRGEHCYYEQNAALISDVAVRIDKKGENVAVDELPLRQTVDSLKTKHICWRKAGEQLGRLYVTNIRIILTDGQTAVEMPLDSVQSVSLYSNLMMLRGREGVRLIATDEAAYVYQVLSAVCREKC